ncbi:MAG: carbon dioxide concentrating mechanism protein [Xenococcaceae cyanobacterium]
MYLPPLQTVSKSDIYMSGDVTIHPSAVVAPGAILQAAPNSRIVIGAGVCVGMGAILNAYQGSIEVETGAILGAGVLIIGKGKIGENACIGAATTIFNASIEPMAVVSAGSLIGDPSRQVAALPEPETVTSEESAVDTESPPPEPELVTSSESVIESESPPLQPETTPEPEVEVQPKNSSEPEPSPEKEKAPVFGKVYINQLLLTLFPQGQSLNRPDQDNE